MREGVVYTGIPSQEELQSAPGVPSQKRMKEGRVAVIECVQEIPCNPCESACRFHAIHIGEQITNLPCIEEEICTGCGLCVAACPGLAITIVDKSYSEEEGTIDFPFEYLPLPKEGDWVKAVNRGGEVVCDARVLKVRQQKAYQGTTVISIAVPMEYVDEVRSIQRLRAKQEGE